MRESGPTRDAAGGPEPDELLSILRELVEELHSHSRFRTEVGLDSRLDRDLGLDSLTRMELLARLESRCQIGLPASLVAEADTPRDLLRGFRSSVVEVRDARSAVETGFETTPGPVPPAGTATLVDALAWHAACHSERVHVRLLDESGGSASLTYGELHDGARRVAGGLAAHGLEPGQSVAIMLPTGLEYLQAFFGTLLAGGVPVPVYPPARLSQLEDHLRRHARILANARARQLVTFAPALPVSRLLSAQIDARLDVLDVEEMLRYPHSDRDWTPTASEVALLQYTSGSTGSPKGVVLTHANLLASLKAMHQALEIDTEDIFVSWLPLYHDMGLIGAWLGSLYYSMPLVLMSPLYFLARPVRWLEAIHRYRATLSGGPNFAYEMCRRRIADADLEGLDLGSWRVAFNGAEPVSPETQNAFAARFAAFGFDPKALTPVYGLAEASLGVAFTPVGRGPRYDRVEREAMQRRGVARASDESGAAAVTIVGSGFPIPGFEVRSVDDSGRETAERRVGRIQFRGPSTTSGYFRNPEASRALFDADWLESGDLGYIADGELFVTGRVKDLIIRGGRNVYPHELEEAAGEVDGVRRGCVAAFGIDDPDSGTERLVVVAETREKESGTRAAMRKAIEEAAIRQIGSPPDEVRLVPPYTVLKTSSGKIRRRALRERYEQGRLEARGASPLPLQVLRLGLSAVIPQFRRAVGRALEAVYGGWFWLAIAFAGAVVWPVAALGPSSRSAGALLHQVARALLFLTGLRPRIDGELPARQGRGRVLVFNHASYIDGLVLSAALSPIPRYVVKGELRANPFARLFLEGIDAFFVERFERRRSAEDAEELSAALAAGAEIGIFAEGTLHRMPGLLPFQLGAFRAAVEAGSAGRAGGAARHPIGIAQRVLVSAPRDRPGAHWGSDRSRLHRSPALGVGTGGALARRNPGADAPSLRGARSRPQSGASRSRGAFGQGRSPGLIRRGRFRAFRVRSRPLSGQEPVAAPAVPESASAARPR